MRKNGKERKMGKEKRMKVVVLQQGKVGISMSLNSFKEMLNNLKGTYDFDFSKDDDCEYIFESYGGKENMKELFPRTYESLFKAKSKALETKNDLTSEEESEICSISLGQLCMRAVEDSKSSKIDSTDDSAYKLEIPVHCWFIDNTKKAQDAESADTWKGITIQAAIKKAFESEYIARYSKVLLETNSYSTKVESPSFMKSEISDQQYDVSVLAQGCDPAGIFHAKAIRDSFKIGSIELFSVKDIQIDDPAPKNDKHIKNNEIVMLYGRVSEQKEFEDADYKSLDYFKNTFDNNTKTVHLLMPLKGKIQLDYGVEPVGLHFNKDEKFVRSKVSYDSKEKVLQYREDMDDKALYNKMLPCFTHDPYDKNKRCNIYFDIKIEDPWSWVLPFPLPLVIGRSAYDWHADLEGVQDANPKTIKLHGSFAYEVINQMGQTSVEKIYIESLSKEELEEKEEKYYTYSGKHINTLYIPPITIYWGCFAGDVLITMFDGTQKKACDIKAGDLFLGYQNKKLKVESIVTGTDQSIYLIETDHGSIKVSGGHPVMCDGSEKRAFEIKPQDRINLAEGSTAEVTNVSIVEFNSTVYNFTFEGETEGRYIIANGFYAGDLKMQNTKKESPKKELTPEDMELFEEAKRFQKMLDNTLD